MRIRRNTYSTLMFEGHNQMTRVVGNAILNKQIVCLLRRCLYAVHSKYCNKLLRAAGLPGKPASFALIRNCPQTIARAYIAACAACCGGNHGNVCLVCINTAVA